MPSSFSVLSREASALMENFGKNTSTELQSKTLQGQNKSQMQFQLVNKFDVQDLFRTDQNSQASSENIQQTLREYTLPSCQVIVPSPEVALVDFGLQFAHLAVIRQDNHHGGVALVGHHENSGVVVKVVVEIVSAGSFHHVDLDPGVLVHVEILLLGLVDIERLLPLSCLDTQ